MNSVESGHILKRMGFEQAGTDTYQRVTPLTNILVDCRKGVISIWNGKATINRRYQEELLAKVDAYWIEYRIALTTLTQLAERHFLDEKQSLGE
jgi:glutamate racemase